MREVFHYFTALGISCKKVEPLIQKVLDKLVNEEIETLPKKGLTATFSGLHAIHNLGSIAKETLKEFESLAGIPPNTSRFHKAEARSCTLLWELSKAFTRTHNYQKAGAVHNF